MQARFFLQDVYNITGLGVIPVGQVKEGILKIGMKLNIDGKVMTVKTMEMHHNQLKEAKPGDNIGITLKDGDRKMLEKLKQTELIFSDQDTMNYSGSLKQNPSQPEGTFSFIKKLFKK
jgi:translation elongation factor EF-1alpha